MNTALRNQLVYRFVIFVVSFAFVFFTFHYITGATGKKANIVIDTKKIVGPMPFNWKALAQGGEEAGVQMLANVVRPVAEIGPHYIRLDHIYDFYNVVTKDANGRLQFNFTELDKTVCDIFETGAKPFFSLGYMPPAISKDGSLISQPQNWNDWSSLVQATVEHYSGLNTTLCGSVSGSRLTGIYYEVWNEPDLESFGKWSLYGGEKDYKTLYFHSVTGAQRAQNVNQFYIGGPATTAPYRNWMQYFLEYISNNNLRIDFISWHHYGVDADDFTSDVQNVTSWLEDSKFDRFRNLPKIISEWGYDSQPNAVAQSKIGAAHTVATIRNLLVQKLDLAFAFEIKDGVQPSWGLLTHSGFPKPRYHAIKMLNNLDRFQLEVQGEGTYVRAIASTGPAKISVILVNYDNRSRHTELVPVNFTNLTPGNYSITQTFMGLAPVTLSNLAVPDGVLRRNIIMPPNSIVHLEIKPENGQLQ